MNNIIKNKIIASEDRMTKSEMGVTDYMLSTDIDLEKTSITMLATKIGCSPSTINRWSNKIGFYGYKDFIAQLRNENKFYDKYQNIITDYSKDVIFSISRTEQDLNYKEMLRLASKISESKKIIFYGESFTYYIAEYYSHMFKKLNIKSQAINLASSLHDVIDDRRYIHCFITLSGNNINVLKAVNKLLEEDRNQYLAVISSSNKTNIDQYVNTKLTGHFYQSNKIDNFELPIIAKSVADYILNQIFIHVYNEKADKYKQVIKNYKKNK